MPALHQHQIDGAAWLAPRARAYLADAPRVGKTRTLLRAAMLRLCPLDSRYAPPRDLHFPPGFAEKILVICPANARTRWRREALALGFALPHVYSYHEIVNRGEVGRMAMLQHGFEVLILDEAHYLCNATSTRTKLICGAQGYARRIGTVWCASGTPIPKNIGQFWTLASGVFGDYTRATWGIRTFEEWCDRFAEIGRREVQLGARRVWQDVIVGIKDKEAFRTYLRGLMLRRTLADLGASVPALDLQDLILDSKFSEYVDPAIASKLAAIIEQGGIDAIERDPHLSRMRRKFGLHKAPVVAEIIADELVLRPEQKVVVLAHHTEVLDAFGGALAAFGLVRFDGATTPKEREMAEREFQTNPAVRVFLGQNQACRENLTLSAAETIYLVEPDWTGAWNVQMAHRIMDVTTKDAHRVAQLCVLANSLDEAIVARSRREIAQSEAIFG
jgi:SWI/SNF-related matrix-associated actin-dependent regulator 1 of chromatin subfamily A